MNKITFFHFADLHLDTSFRTLASKPGLPSLRRKSLFDGLSLLIEKAKKERPQFLFVSGDLFEHEYAGLKTISAVNNLFASIPDTKIVMIAGNHDPEAANSYYRTFKWADNVWFLGDDKNSIYFADLNTEIFGLGWVSGTGQAPGINSMDIKSDRINVLLFHGDIDLQIGGRDYNSISSVLLKSKGFNYIAAGHNHKKREREIGGIFFNPGSLEPLGFDEPGVHGFFSGTIYEDSLPIVEFRKNSTVLYETIELDISEYTQNIQITDALNKLLKPEDFLYKIVLTGNKQIDFNPDTAILENDFVNKTLFIKVRDKSTVHISMEELSLMKGLKGIFTNTILEQMENADEEDKTLLEKALYYGIEAIDSGKIQRAGGEDI